MEAATGVEPVMEVLQTPTTLKSAGTIYSRGQCFT